MSQQEPALPFREGDLNRSEPMLPIRDARALLAHLGRTLTKAGRARPVRRMVAPAYAGLLEHADPEVVTAAADALGRLGSSAECAVPALVAQLGRPDEPIARFAMRALARIGHVAVRTGLVHVIRLANAAEEVSSCVRLLGVAGCSGRNLPDSLLPTVLRLLAAGELPTIHDNLGTAFPVWSPESRRTIATAAVETLRCGDRERRVALARLMAMLGSGAEPAGGALLDAFRCSDDSELLVHCGDALARIGGDTARTAVAHLRPVVSGTNGFRTRRCGEDSGIPGMPYSDRMAAILQLRRLGCGPAVADCVRLLTEQLSDTSVQVREAVMGQLSALVQFHSLTGYEDLPAGQQRDLLLPALRRSAEDPSSQVRFFVVQTLGRLALSVADDVVPLLLARLGDVDIPIDCAVQALIRLGTAAARLGVERLAGLTRMGGPREARLRWPHAIRCLGLDPADAAFEALSRLLSDCDAEVRLVACETVRARAEQLDPEHRAVFVGTLRSWRTSPYPQLRSSARSTLRTLGVPDA